MNAFNAIVTIWSEEPEAPEEPEAQPQLPLETSPPITWQELQAEQNRKISTIIQRRRIEKIGGYYNHIIGC